MSAKFTLLGSGPSTGVPAPGCVCRICQSAHPRNKRYRSAAVIETGGFSILIDTSPDFRIQALNHGLQRVDAILYTHAHADHILGLDELKCYNFRQPDPVPVYGSALTFHHIGQVFSYIFNPDPNYQGTTSVRIVLHEIVEGKTFHFHKIPILPFLMHHGKLRVTGYRIGNLAYATDCNLLPEETYQALTGVKYLILDALRYEAHQSHFTIPQAIEAAQRIGAEKTYLTHLSHAVDYEEVAPKLPQGIELAYDGLQIEFSETTL